MTDDEHTERAILQRKIKNQRKALRELNKTMRIYNAMIRQYALERGTERSSAYRHAAVLAESRSWWFGPRIARTIRRWV
jgi:hypothetical protein